MSRRLVAAGLVVIFALCLLPVQTFAAVPPINDDDLNVLNTGREPYYWGNQTQCGASGTTAPTLVGGDNEQQAFNYFVQQGLSAAQAAGVVGNLMVESGVNPTILQKGGNSTNPNDAGTDSSNDGWGIAQWSPGGKVIGIAQSLNITGPIYELATQLQIVWGEMNGTSPTGVQDMLTSLKQTTDTASAAENFEQNFEEGPVAATGAGDLSGRQADAQQVLTQYGGSAANVGTSGSSGSACNTVSCTTSTTSTTTSSTSGSVTSASAPDTLSATRQNVVCIAQQELALWKSQPNYNSPYPAFTYAQTGFLKYSDNNYEEWCADFVSWVYNQAQYPFSGGASSGGWRLAGVLGIQQLGTQNQNFHWHPESSGYVPKPGDLAIHYNSAYTNPWYHVNIFISSSGGVSTYIGGDQNGVDQPGDAYGSKDPPSGSVVSTETGSGYYDNDINGYVSPD